MTMENHTQARNGGMEGVESKVRVETTTAFGGCDLVLRVLAFVLTLVAAILLGVDNQTKVVPVLVSPILPPLNVPVTAKWNYLSAFVYFVVANAISCAYVVLSLLVSIADRKENNRRSSFAIIVADVVMVALLFSGNGAAAAVGLIGYQGNSHVKWNKVCDVFGKFCDQAAAAILLSLAGSIAYLLLVVLAAVRIQRKNR